jgi:hypothetical protein
MKSPKEMHEGIVNHLPKNTGKTLDQWMELVKKKGPEDRKEQVEWLKVKCNLDNVQAKTIVKMMHEGLADYDEDDLMKQHFNNDKVYQKPIFEKMIAFIKKFGKLSISVNKTYLSLRNNQQFALVKTSKDGLIIGVPGAAVKSAKSKEFIPAKNLGSDKITHKIVMNDVTDVNDDVVKVLKASYDYANRQMAASKKS